MPRQGDHNELLAKVAKRAERAQLLVLIMQIHLGVLLLNENKLDEMSQILTKYMELVPTLPAEGHHV